MRERERVREREREREQRATYLPDGIEAFRRFASSCALYTLT